MQKKEIEAQRLGLISQFSVFLLFALYCVVSPIPELSYQFKEIYYNSLLYSVDQKTNFKTNFRNLNKFSVHCLDMRPTCFLVFTANILAPEYLEHFLLSTSPKPHPPIQQNQTKHKENTAWIAKIYEQSALPNVFTYSLIKTCLRKVIHKEQNRPFYPFP